MGEGRAVRRVQGSGIDVRDGYIHFSTAQQVVATAAMHFAGVHGLKLVAVDADALGPDLRWEPARDGSLFPHLYGRLAVAHAIWVRDLPLDDAGRHSSPICRPVTRFSAGSLSPRGREQDGDSPLQRVRRSPSANTCAPSTMSSSSVFSRPVMADAADRRHEHHRRRQLARERLRVVAGAQGMRMCLPGRVRFGRVVERVDAGARPSGPAWCASTVDALDLAAAGALARRDQLVERRLAAGRARRIGVAQLEQRFGLAGNDAAGAPGSSDDRARWSTRCAGRRLRESAPSIALSSRTSASAGIAPPRHGGRAGMVLLAADGEAVLPDADDRGDDADALAPSLSSVSPCSICASKNAA